MWKVNGPLVRWHIRAFGHVTHVTEIALIRGQTLTCVKFNVIRWKFVIVKIKEGDGFF
jgi:hypothetical protein